MCQNGLLGTHGLTKNHSIKLYNITWYKITLYIHSRKIHQMYMHKTSSKKCNFKPLADSDIQLHVDVHKAYTNTLKLL